MKTAQLLNYARDRWLPGDAVSLVELPSAIDGSPVALTGSGGLDFAGMATYAREVGGPALRRMTFHDRARMLKALGLAILARKEELYELNYATGCTRKDGWIDIEGGAGTLLSFSSKGRRELPDAHVLLDGQLEPLSKSGAFVGQHVFTSLQGVAVHINAYNFPVWGMLEKLAPTLLAGVPAIVKPASATAWLTEVAFRVMIEAGVLPPGAVQLVVGGVGDLFDHLTLQDIVSFTGSAATALKLQTHPVIARESVRFVAERDSLNASVLGPDAAPGTPEFDLFVREVVTEMTVKAGQKCTAIRRALAPAEHLDAVEAAIRDRLTKIIVGDPREKGTRMGALVNVGQREDVKKRIAEIAAAGARVVAGDPEASVGPDGGAFLQPVLLRADDPWACAAAHDVEPFGPVSTVMPYRDLDDAVKLANRGRGSLVLSLFTHSPEAARDFVLGAAAFHGRMLVIDRTNAQDSTGHGSPLPVLTHGGPGRAGGGEEMGGVRGVMHYMQRTAVQSSPGMIAAITDQYIPGGPKHEIGVHPFRCRMSELSIGDTLKTASRTVTLEDIEHFAHFTGDTFYAHMDEEAAKASPVFEGRVVHGYLILSFAAGLFVDPDPGPVLANTGLESLRFLTPLYPGDSMRVELTVRAKSLKSGDTGVVRWAVEIFNQNDEMVATYDLLTENVP
ncbi:MAG: 3-oxo-5,6-dehydrosuberyl-CoA semialdehyde dehydrogenase / 2-oxepin-2(3H)-ylideneacetyl-CoA hydrolase [uncultured Sphingomonas sp.]|uniref:3-oxo-5,6-dehydrosuberyl-CoA semialdehyde dehydrogenase / 2-oxepin-2(3H)-ylideneacetyl-CoA hydrolase n=1 Tax=uncultured Sphingomonas sp. TaxID=158754 RepID=A0A6J4T8S2_9SPHN|nr:phenylacetic acid degradation bifunctional protein PaaZ [uncultured Sphingomonas sp.]CAA9516244.1 MAG: 3-oxo-5,6-dehydrosuberyl-CoA semialdehyde dehydrogenase / 2-oxepin-2(3H)-ylideneacetyl-CoA hydrolase [uncultured Sphingomonas sp.]